jgi:hypothetical protein
MQGSVRKTPSWHTTNKTQSFKLPTSIGELVPQKVRKCMTVNYFLIFDFILSYKLLIGYLNDSLCDLIGLP